MTSSLKRLCSSCRNNSASQILSLQIHFSNICIKMWRDEENSWWKNLKFIHLLQWRLVKAIMIIGRNKYKYQESFIFFKRHSSRLHATKNVEEKFIGSLFRPHERSQEYTGCIPVKRCQTPALKKNFTLLIFTCSTLEQTKTYIYLFVLL